MNAETDILETIKILYQSLRLAWQLCKLFRRLIRWYRHDKQRRTSPTLRARP